MALRQDALGGPKKNAGPSLHAAKEKVMRKAILITIESGTGSQGDAKFTVGDSVPSPERR